MLHLVKKEVMAPRSERLDLAAAYQMLALLGFDDMVATHLSTRANNNKGFWLPPFGYLFEEITQSYLKHVSFDNPDDPAINPTAAVLHTAIYKARPDIKAVFHVHTEATIAVSSIKGGLKPLSQWSLYFHNQMATYPYDGLALDHKDQAARVVSALGDKKILLLENHGVIVCGDSAAEAFHYLYNFERACRAQCLLSHVPEDQLIFIPEEMRQETYDALMAIEAPVGEKPFQAMLRKLERKGVIYAD